MVNEGIAIDVGRVTSLGILEIVAVEGLLEFVNVLSQPLRLLGRNFVTFGLDIKELASVARAKRRFLPESRTAQHRNATIRIVNLIGMIFFDNVTSGDVRLGKVPRSELLDIDAVFASL